MLGFFFFFFLPTVHCPAFSETNIQPNEVWHRCTLKDRLQSQRQRATVFYEPGLKLKSALLPLTIIHQPSFTLTLLLCKCLYRISCSGWVRERHSAQTKKTLAQLNAGSFDKHTHKCNDSCSLCQHTQSICDCQRYSWIALLHCCGLKDKADNIVHFSYSQ